MIGDYIESLMKKTEYAIMAYSIDEANVILFVSELTPEQAEIPRFIDGRQVKIFRSI